MLCAYIGRHDDNHAVASRFKLEKGKLRICLEFDFGNQFHACGYVATWLFELFFNVTFFFNYNLIDLVNLNRLILKINLN